MGLGLSGNLRLEGLHVGLNALLLLLNSLDLVTQLSALVVVGLLLGIHLRLQRLKAGLDSLLLLLHGAQAVCDFHHVVAELIAHLGVRREVGLHLLVSAPGPLDGACCLLKRRLQCGHLVPKLSSLLAGPLVLALQLLVGVHGRLELVKGALEVQKVVLLQPVVLGTQLVVLRLQRLAVLDQKVELLHGGLRVLLENEDLRFHLLLKSLLQSAILSAQLLDLHPAFDDLGVALQLHLQLLVLSYGGPTLLPPELSGRGRELALQPLQVLLPEPDHELGALERGLKLLRQPSQGFHLCGEPAPLLLVGVPLRG